MASHIQYNYVYYNMQTYIIEQCEILFITHEIIDMYNQSLLRNYFY